MRKYLDEKITSQTWLKAMLLVFSHPCHVTGSFLHTVLHGRYFRDLRPWRYCRFLPVEDRRQHTVERYRVHESSAPSSAGPPLHAHEHLANDLRRCQGFTRAAFLSHVHLCVLIDRFRHFVLLIRAFTWLRTDFDSWRYVVVELNNNYPRIWRLIPRYKCREGVRCSLLNNGCTCYIATASGHRQQLSEGEEPRKNWKNETGTYSPLQDIQLIFKRILALPASTTKKAKTIFFMFDDRKAWDFLRS